MKLILNKTRFFVMVIFCYLSLSLSLSCPYSSLTERPFLSGRSEKPFHDEANKYLDQGDYENAVKSYEKALEQYRPTVYCINFVISNKLKVYQKVGRQDLAVQTIHSLRDMPVVPTTLYGPDVHAYGLEREFYIWYTLGKWDEEAGEYEEAIKKYTEAIKWHFKKIKATDYETISKQQLDPFDPESRQALDLLQIGPGILGNVYFKWGKYALARDKYNEEINFLTSESVRNQIIEKLEPRYKMAWAEINPKIVFPINVAECFEKEGNYTEALILAFQAKKVLEDPSLKQKYGENYDFHTSRMEIILNRDLLPLIVRCKEKTKK